MKKIFSGFKDEQDGAIAIEACISLTLFLIVMIALYSVIQVFTVQSMISHAMQEACQSMALENYNQSMFKTGTLQQIPSKVFDWISGGHRENFSTSADFSWKELLLPSSSTSGEAQTALYDSNAKQRFAAYLGGGVEKADELLKNYGVVGGLDGISFAGTEKSGTDMTIQVSYKVRLLFYIVMFHFGEFESTQTVCCRLWK